MFAGLGRAFDAEERQQLRAALSSQLEKGFATSVNSKIIVEYRTEEPPNVGLTYDVTVEAITLEDEYEEWVKSRQPPLFGANPDAKLLSLVHAFGSPEQVAVLDVGAGTGRNTLPLAKAGFRVDAVEIAPALARVLREDLARACAHDTRVFEGDALDPKLGVPEQTYQLIVLAEVVASHFHDVSQVRALFERAQAWLAPGGLLLFSAFLARDGYEPDRLAKQASQVFWSCLFTRAELAEASRGLDLLLISDESTYAFEKKHLAGAAWPPTGWFADWARGRDLFHLPGGKAPHELRWVVYRKAGKPFASSDEYATSASLHISAPRERVFDLAFDARAAKKIFRPTTPIPGIAKLELPSGELASGAQRRITWSDASQTTEHVLEHARPFHHAHQFSNTLRGPLSWIFGNAHAHWTLAPTNEGTIVYWTYRFEPRLRLTRRFMGIVQAAFQRWMRNSLQALREQAERT